MPREGERKLLDCEKVQFLEEIRINRDELIGHAGRSIGGTNKMPIDLKKWEYIKNMVRLQEWNTLAAWLVAEGSPELIAAAMHEVRYRCVAFGV